jgi:hypothetical protein
MTRMTNTQENTRAILENTLAHLAHATIEGEILDLRLRAAHLNHPTTNLHQAHTTLTAITTHITAASNQLGSLYQHLQNKNWP